MANEDDRAFDAQRDRDLAELYPTSEEWERGYPPMKRPEEPELRQQYDDLLQLQEASSRTQQALKHTHASAQIAEQHKRELDTHDRIWLRGAAHSARDVLHDSGPGKEPGTYTTYEARDRAAHAGHGEPEK